MARLKFVVFALLALGLWAYQFNQVVPLALNGAVEQAQTAVSGAAGPVALAMESRRSLVQAMALKVSTSGANWNGMKGGPKPESPTAERLVPVRSAASEVVPDALKSVVFVALVNDTGALWAQGDADPSSGLPADWPTAAPSVAGAVMSLQGVDLFVLSVPWWVGDKGEPKSVGSMWVGLPLLPEPAVLEGVVKSLGLSTLAVAVDGKAAVQVGKKGGAEEVLSKLKANAVGPLTFGPVRELGPLQLPLLADGTPQAFGGRLAVGGTQYEVVASASVMPALEVLANHQVFGLGAFAGMLLIALAVLVMLGGEEAAPSMVVSPPLPLPPVASRKEKEDGSGAKPMPRAALSLQETPPPQEATPDDFDFPAAPPAAPVEPTFETRAERSSPPAAPPPPSMGVMSDPFSTDEQAEQTVAYPPYQSPAVPAVAPADPFASSSGYGEENPEATRVAAVPAELIRAARAATATETPAPDLTAGAVLPRVASVAPAGGFNEEERHFQDIYRDFVATREKCGEPPDGLTFDKFKLKLLKTKDQLMAKHQCRTIRFQVYVKDGKAALKAAPVKD